jgi:DNA repair protein RadC
MEQRSDSTQLGESIARNGFALNAFSKTGPTNYRAELRDRFLRAGCDALSDLEMLELVLFRAVARADVTPLCKRLIARFGDFNHVISAPTRQLETIEGVGAAILRELKIVEAAAHRLSKARVIDRPALSSWGALMDYCKVSMAHLPNEQFRLLFLDRRNVLIADETQSAGTVDHVPVYPREVVKRALELNASALILVHNHPSGDPSPSEVDIDMTTRIETALDSVGITLHDHVIIGKSHDSSFKTLGLI